ncbi:leukotriene B4 receptor 1-like [Salvelinus namaycush]|uniref:Leukotriene B4 receptor 1-like n=1 Tax=Salvelinus namaycush TaxID=8040 RepID=A0A8U0R4D5_SALNM|nr:leukotriene B4 receptor 1-like [Salvelinus namaycush]
MKSSGSSISDDDDALSLEMSTVGRSVVCVILGLSFLVGVPGNLLVIWTILRHVQQRSHTVVLILQLAAADLLVLITLPLWIYSLARSWVFGEASCKAMVYVINTCMYSSVFLITLMSVERFLVIRYPFKMLRWKTKAIMDKALVAIWALAFLLGIPSIFTRSIDEIDGTEQCLFREYSSGAHEVVFLCLETLVGFVVPFSTLAVCSCLVATHLRTMHFGSSKRKSTVLISSVVVAFVLCWLPHHVLNTVDLVSILTEDPDDAVPVSVAQTAIVFISGALAFISSSVNPVFYSFAARNFQGSLQESRMVRLFQELSSHTSSKLRGSGNTIGSENTIGSGNRIGSENTMSSVRPDCNNTTDITTV